MLSWTDFSFYYLLTHFQHIFSHIEIWGCLNDFISWTVNGKSFEFSQLFPTMLLIQNGFENWKYAHNTLFYLLYMKNHLLHSYLDQAIL